MQTIEELVEIFKSYDLEVPIKEEPMTSLKELLGFENEYQMNTDDALQLYKELGEKVHFNHKYQYLVKWVDVFRTYLRFKGDTSLINTIHPIDEQTERKKER